jgi:hypothetical protein
LAATFGGAALLEAAFFRTGFAWEGVLTARFFGAALGAARLGTVFLAAAARRLAGGGFCLGSAAFAGVLDLATGWL